MPVSGAVGDEVAGDLLGCLDAVGLEVLGQHRGRNIDRQHDVDAFGVARRAFIDRLGAGQRYDEERDGRAAQRERQMPQVITYGARCFGDTVDGRYLDRSAALTGPPDVIDHHERNDREPATKSMERRIA